MAQEEELQYLVRVANTDLAGPKPLYHALCKIKGVSFVFSRMLCHLSKLDPAMKAGYLTDEQVQQIERILADPIGNGAPVWILNRRKDVETGADMHLLTGDLKFTLENDVKRLKKTRSYRGFRHAAGQPTRGQRTRSNFRRSKSRGKGGLGVKRGKGGGGGGAKSGGSKGGGAKAGGKSGGKKK